MSGCSTDRCGCSGARCGSANASLATGTGTVTVVANNQEITSVADVGALMTTDPYRLGDNDRATVMWNVNSIWALGGGTTTLNWSAEVSNDGVNWVDVGGAMSDARDVSTTLRHRDFEFNEQPPVRSSPALRSLAREG